MNNASSILNSTKHMLGLSSDYDAFDLDIITNINSTFAILHQMGVGPDECFSIEGASETWDDFFGSNAHANMVKSYMYAKVRMNFDPPQSGTLVDSYNKIISEFEWRLYADYDT